MSRLSIDLKVGETISLNDGAVRITLEKKSGQLARLLIEADHKTDIVTPRRSNNTRPLRSSAGANLTYLENDNG